jgi:nucleoside-diphosphate-sugar epimerase
MTTWFLTFLVLGLKILPSSTFSAIPKPTRASLVTGANGYVGREIVHELLNQNAGEERIVCLVRESRVEEETKYWKGRSADCILVQPYDMLDGGRSLEDALQRVYSPDTQCVVYHVASVFGPTEDHKQTALDNVKGTEDLVLCLAKFPSTKLVLTSSMAAVRGSGQEPKNGECYSYLDWNTLSELGVNWGSSYQWSKAESERKAWELAKDHDVPMVSLCPSFVFGPTTDGTFESNSYSIQLVGQWIHGESEVQSRLCVDVRDVAKAHVAAGTREVALEQRYILSRESRLSSEILAEAIKEVSPTPETITYDAEFDGGAIKIGDREVIATARLEEELGIELTPSDVTFRDMAEAILAQ